MTDTQGKLLVAPPGMPDWRFQKTVIYMWRHDVAGAAGVIINKKCQHPDFKHVCSEGNVHRNPDVNPPVFYGGPVLTNILGVLHSKDWQIGSSNTDNQQPLAFTLDKKILDTIAKGGGPEKQIITLGMCNWEQGQLESELDPQPPRPKTMSWLVLPYDEEIVFGPKREDHWETCVNKAVSDKTAEFTDKFFKS
jgi:putative transcriptional regulator